MGFLEYLYGLVYVRTWDETSYTHHSFTKRDIHIWHNQVDVRPGV